MGFVYGVLKIQEAFSIQIEEERAGPGILADQDQE
jgi:hypothetical protein